MKKGMLAALLIPAFALLYVGGNMNHGVPAAFGIVLTLAIAGVTIAQK
jgi:hypothetical protein